VGAKFVDQLQDIWGFCTHCECVQREKERRDIASLPEIERFCFARFKKVIPTASTFFLWEHKSWRAKRLKDRRVFVHWRFSNDGGGGGGRVGRKKIKKFSNRVSSYVPLDILYITWPECKCVWVYTKYCNVVTVVWVCVCNYPLPVFVCLIPTGISWLHTIGLVWDFRPSSAVWHWELRLVSLLVCVVSTQENADKTKSSLP